MSAQAFSPTVDETPNETRPAKDTPDRDNTNARKTNWQPRELSIFLFAPALLVALAKDILDLFAAMLIFIPVIGWGTSIIFSWIVSIFAYFFIGFSLALATSRMFYTGPEGSIHFVRPSLSTIAVMSGSFLVEALGWIINFLPIATITVFYLFWHNRKRFRAHQRMTLKKYLKRRNMMTLRA